MINNITLAGRLTKDSDLRYTSDGTAVGTFTLAVNRQFTNQIPLVIIAWDRKTKTFVEVG